MENVPFDVPVLLTRRHLLPTNARTYRRIAGASEARLALKPLCPWSMGM
jgi:hypothetical protein